jgi:benzaldehyde dehydrogenase (NAD)
MAAGRHLVHASVFDEYVSRLSATVSRLTVGDPAVSDVTLGPLIDQQQRDRVHSLVTSAVDAGARLAAGGTYEGLFYRPTVLSDVTTTMPVYDQEVFGPVAPVLPFGSASEAVELAAASPYGLSLGILSRDPLRALSLAERIPTGIVHINDQTVDDQQVVPFGGVGVSGTGSRFGGAAANIEAFTETQWVTLQSEIPRYPF